MICRRCGKDVVGTNKCLYCGKVLDSFVNTGSGGGEGEPSATQNDFANGQTTSGASSSYQDYGSTYGVGGYGDTSYSEYEDNSPEGFYHQYKESNMLEKGKKVIDILKKVVLFAGLAAIVGLIVSIAMESNIVPELFGFDVYNGTDEEMFEFINKLFMFFMAIFLAPLVFTCISDILDWLSMKNFADEVSSKEIDGKTLLTKSRLSDKNGKKEYTFVSNSLCMIDDPSQKTAMGARVIIKAILNIAMIIVFMNFVSYLTLTLMPAMEDPDEIYLMMYSSTDFWLDPNILSIVIAFWGNLIINSITSTIVNKKYTRWVNNNKSKGEQKQ